MLESTGPGLQTIRFGELCTCLLMVISPHGVRCSSVVRAFAHGAMGHQINPSWYTHRAVSVSSQCSTTGIKKPCYVVSCLWDDAYKRTLTTNWKE